jgi:tetratricopeptide (TPR) repeat protein
MGKSLVEKLMPALSPTRFPQNPAVTQLGYTSYQNAILQADTYENNPQPLVNALKTLQTGDSAPFAFGGVAYVLVKASRENDDSYDAGGLDAALSWLEMAQEHAPDLMEINVTETLIYIYGGRYDDARVVLDYLGGVNAGNYYLALAEIAYWQRVGDSKQVENWFNRAYQVAPNGPAKLNLQNQLADYFANTQQYERALEEYRKVVHFHKNDPIPWHKMSIVYLKMDDLEQAIHCNNRSLTLGETPNGKKMSIYLQEKIKDEKKGWRSLLG